LKFERLDLPGVFLISEERRVDERGHFARLWCDEEFAQHGLVNRLRQINTGFSPQAGTLRGMHYQLPPAAEVKVVRCARGAVFDVAVDLRRGSPSFGRWAGTELCAGDGRMLYVPKGFAHGYLTLVDDSELVYLTSAAYVAATARGVRYDDPAIAVRWPAAVRIVSAADRSWPDLADASPVELEG